MFLEEPPSWSNYATHDESRYPWLWNGCVYAAAPCLGPTGGKLFDLSGYNNHGDLVNAEMADWGLYGIGQYRPGVGYGARQFGLDFGGDDGVVVPYHKILQPVEITVSAWVMLYGSNQEDGIIAVYQGTNCSWAMIIKSDSQRFEFYISETGIYDATHYASATNTSDGNWHHVVGRGKIGEKTQLYIDGVLEAQSSANITTGVWQSGTPQLEIGRWGNGYAAGFLNGGVDDLRVYNRPLAVEEINLLGMRRGIAYERNFRSRNMAFLTGGGGGGGGGDDGSASKRRRRRNLLIG